MALNIKVVGDTIFYDGVAIADLRDDVLATHRDDFIQHVERHSTGYSDSESNMAKEASYDRGFDDGKKEGYDEGYADCAAELEAGK